MSTTNRCLPRFTLPSVSTGRIILTPDAVWLTIAQGVAQHMAIHGERLRSRFVSHQGKLDLVFECRDWVEGTPENPWVEAFESWAGQIRNHVGTKIYDTLACDFTTSASRCREQHHRPRR